MSGEVLSISQQAETDGDTRRWTYQKKKKEKTKLVTMILQLYTHLGIPPPPFKDI